jgi:hypothetical protein
VNFFAGFFGWFFFFAGFMLEHWGKLSRTLYQKGGGQEKGQGPTFQHQNEYSSSLASTHAENFTVSR